jgi:hypothetical protein
MHVRRLGPLRAACLTHTRVCGTGQ